jgi:hypothetical protein
VVFLLLIANCYLLTPAQLLAAPRVVWTARYDGPVHGEDKLTGLVTDTAGNCWLSGYSFGDTTDFDFATLRVSPQGRTVWTRRYGSPLKCEDRSWCLARDSAGSIIAAGGSIADFNIGWDFLLIKYNRAGDRVWLRRYDSPFHSDDKPAALAVGPKNCLYVAGFSKRKTTETGVGRDASGVKRTDTDVSLVKYSAKGDTLWQRFYNGRAGMDDGAAAIAVDRAGNCYVVARVVNRQPGTDITLLKYRADGSLAWFRDIDGPGHSTDMPAAVLLSDSPLAPRPSPLVYVVGSVTGAGTSFDYYTSCFDTTGNQLWQQTYDGAGRVDVASAACLDSAGSIIVTGQSTGAASSFDVATVKYSPTGERVWARRYNGTRNGADRGSCIVADRQGRVIVGGNSVGATGFPDMVLLGYSPEGDTLWIFTHAGTGAGESKPAVILPAPANSPPATRNSQLFVAGYENNTNTGFDYLLMLLEE